MKKMKICKKCLMPETRPRLTFDSDGICAACEWHMIKKERLDWKERYSEIQELCDEIRGKQRYDCIVPVSGGKDSTYVADKMKNELNLNVLTVTITPPLETRLIQENMNNFLKYGFDNIKVTPNPKIAQEINKYGFIEQGRPLLSWTSCLNSVMFKMAVDYKVPLIMFGEEGETEYGGTKEMRYKPYYDAEFAINIYTEGNNMTDFLGKYTEREMSMWMYPTKDEVEQVGIKVGHWSYFEDWDAYTHYEFARDNYGMKCHEGNNVGTYTNYGQLDTPLYHLHTYMMYLKFGFGHGLQDACIDIRNGRLTRKEAIKLVNKYDGEYPEENIPMYLEYYELTKEQFDSVLDKHANKKLFRKENGIWKPQFSIK